MWGGVAEDAKSGSELAKGAWVKTECVLKSESLARPTKQNHIHWKLAAADTKLEVSKNHPMLSSRLGKIDIYI